MIFLGGGDKMIFEYKLKELCYKKSITIKRLSELSGISESTIRRMMIRGDSNIRIGTILKLCKGLSVDLDEFLVIHIV